MQKLNRRNFIALGSTTAILAMTGQAGAADWPSRPVVVVAPYPAGGGSDTMARTIAEALSAAFNQTFVVENHDGAAGAIGGGIVARADPDGYTMMIGASAPLAANKLVQRDLAYDPETDFTPLSLIGETPLVLMASPSLEVTSVQEFIDYAQANPGRVSCGNAGAGAKGHIAAALLAQMAGIELNYVSYRGSAPLLTDLLGGHLPFAIDTISTYLPHIEAGNVRALGLTASVRSPRLPDVATIAEQGVDGYEATLWYGAVAPAGVSDEIAPKVSAVIKEWLDTPEGQEVFARLGVAPIGGSPEDLRQAIETEIASLRPLVESGMLSTD